jgi:hypothetical protein
MDTAPAYGAGDSEFESRHGFCPSGGGQGQKREWKVQRELSGLRYCTKVKVKVAGQGRWNGGSYLGYLECWGSRGFQKILEILEVRH